MNIDHLSSISCQCSKMMLPLPTIHQGIYFIGRSIVQTYEIHRNLKIEKTCYEKPSVKGEERSDGGLCATKPHGKRYILVTLCQKIIQVHKLMDLIIVHLINTKTSIISIYLSNVPKSCSHTSTIHQGIFLHVLFYLFF